MTSHLKFVQQNWCEKEVVPARCQSEPHSPAPEAILRQALERHRAYKAYVANDSLHKTRPNLTRIGLSRMQFGDGEFDQAVEAFRRVVEDEPRSEPLLEMAAPVARTRTLSRSRLRDGGSGGGGGGPTASPSRAALMRSVTFGAPGLDPMGLRRRLDVATTTPVGLSRGDGDEGSASGGAGAEDGEDMARQVAVMEAAGVEIGGCDSDDTGEETGGGGSAAAAGGFAFDAFRRPQPPAAPLTAHSPPWRGERFLRGTSLRRHNPLEPDGSQHSADGLPMAAAAAGRRWPVSSKEVTRAASSTAPGDGAEPAEGGPPGRQTGREAAKGLSGAHLRHDLSSSRRCSMPEAPLPALQDNRRPPHKAPSMPSTAASVLAAPGSSFARLRVSLPGTATPAAAVPAAVPAAAAAASSAGLGGVSPTRGSSSRDASAAAAAAAAARSRDSPVSPFTRPQPPVTPSATERTDRLLRILLQQEQKHYHQQLPRSGGTSLPGAKAGTVSHSSSNASLEAIEEAPSRCHLLSRMRHPSLRLSGDYSSPKSPRSSLDIHSHVPPASVSAPYNFAGVSSLAADSSADSGCSNHGQSSEQLPMLLSRGEPPPYLRARSLPHRGRSTAAEVEEHEDGNGEGERALRTSMSSAAGAEAGGGGAPVDLQQQPPAKMRLSYGGAAAAAGPNRTAEGVVLTGWSSRQLLQPQPPGRHPPRHSTPGGGWFTGEGPSAAAAVAGAVAGAFPASRQPRGGGGDGNHLGHTAPLAKAEALEAARGSTGGEGACPDSNCSAEAGGVVSSMAVSSRGNLDPDHDGDHDGDDAAAAAAVISVALLSRRLSFRRSQR